MIISSSHLKLIEAHEKYRFFVMKDRKFAYKKN